MPRYASGKFAFRQCKCGYKVPYNSVKYEPQTGTYACSECWDPDFRKRQKVPVDSSALRDPSPENNKENKTVTPFRYDIDSGTKYNLSFELTAQLGCCIAINGVIFEDSLVTTMSQGEQVVLPGYVIPNDLGAITSSLASISAVNVAITADSQVMTASLADVVIPGWSYNGWGDGSWGHV